MGERLRPRKPASRAMKATVVVKEVEIADVMGDVRGGVVRRGVAVTADAVTAATVAVADRVGTVVDMVGRGGEQGEQGEQRGQGGGIDVGQRILAPQLRPRATKMCLGRMDPPIWAIARNRDFMIPMRSKERRSSKQTKPDLMAGPVLFCGYKGNVVF